MQTSHQTAELLEEILLPPSNKIITNRFSDQTNDAAAHCSGTCSGVCHARGIENSDES